MKRHLPALLVIVAVATGFGTGAIAGALLMQRAMFDATADRDAWDTLERIEVLSRLRLEQTAAAIDLLETPLGDRILFVAAAHPPESAPREEVSFRALLAAKAYLNIFPLADSTGTAVDSALDKVPLLQDSERYPAGVGQMMLRFRPAPLAPNFGT